MFLAPCPVPRAPCAARRWDSDCELFYKILVGEVPEEAYYDQANMMQYLKVRSRACAGVRACVRVCVRAWRSGGGS